MPQHWAILRIASGPGGLVGHVELDDGRVLSGRGVVRDLPLQFRPGEPGTPVSVTVPAATVEAVADLIADSPESPLAMFVAPPDSLAGMSWEPALEALLEPLDRDRWRGARLARRPRFAWGERKRIAGPLDVLLSDDVAGLYRSSMEREAGPWMRVAHAGDIASALRELSPDIVIAGAGTVARLAGARIGHSPLELLIAASDDEAALQLRTAELPGARSLMVVSPDRLGDVLDGIIANEPLHAAAPIEGAPVLVTDPAADHALRVLPRMEVEEARYPARRGRAAPRRLPSPWRRARPERRSVDVRLADERDRWLTRRSSLVPRGRYVLEVQIGRRDPDRSLLEREGPPVDPLLPPPDAGAGGHFLRVVVHPLDFRLLSERTRPVTLPLAGESRAEHFYLEAPDEVDRPLRLRIAVHHHASLIQTLLLTAAGGRLEVDVEHTITEDFGNLDELEPRSLSLAHNVGPDGHHDVYVTVDGASYDVPLAVDAMDKLLKRFRTILRSATFMAGSESVSLWPDVPDVNTLARDDYQQVVRDLARLGRDVWKGIFQDPNPDAPFKDVLLRLRTSRNEVVQATYLKEFIGFPWTAVYDRRPPRTQDDQRVCYGFGPGVLPPDGAPEATCGHTEQDRIYCVEGFWALRHQLEFVRGSRTRENLPVTIARGAGPDVAVTVGLHDQFTDGLVERLRCDLPPGRRVTEIPESLLDALWDDASRPTIAVIVAHMEAGPRIQLDDDWVSDDDITSREEDDRAWRSAPRPLILLMSCESSLDDPDRLGSFSRAFMSAGAAGMVGTEVPAFTPLLCHFATDVVLALLGGAKLGRAMTEFRRRTLLSGNPLPFVFTPLGSADLHLT